MEYVTLGKGGLRVSELALGAMTFGMPAWGADEAESGRIYGLYREAGGNFVDTANVYGDSEDYLGRLLQSHRDEVVLASKYSFPRRKDINGQGNSRKNMMVSVNESLKRLKTDYIDLYWVHYKDHTTPIEEIMRGLDDLVTQGKVLYVGLSDFPAWQVGRADMLAQLRGWAPVVALQIKYSLVARDVEHELLPAARALDMAVAAWAPLGAGVLTGKYNAAADGSGRLKGGEDVPEQHRRIAAEVAAVAQELGATPAQVALSWVRQARGVVVPIVGARTVEQIKDNLGALRVTLSPEHHDRLTKVSEIPTPWPYGPLARFVPENLRAHRASEN
jgi:aryl-alcohol dehydrogenase-like predicted oxidoreductase